MHGKHANKRPLKKTGESNMFDPNSHIYDIESKEIPNIFYMICSVPRSGSTFLGRALWDTNLAGFPHEYFHKKRHMKILTARWGVDHFQEYIACLKLKRSTPNGVFGFKAHFYQYEQELANKELNSIFPDLQHIFISRKDHLRQAISFARALQTMKYGHEEPEKTKPHFDFQQIEHCIKWIEREEQEWEKYFSRNNVAPCRVVYENLAESYEETVIDVLKFLNIKVPNDFKVKPPQIKKQADQLTEEWLHRYLSLKSSSILVSSINKQNDNNGLNQQHFFIEKQSDHISSVFNNVDNVPEVQTTKVKACEQSSNLPKISVVIFSYNFERYLRECVESILAQTLRPFEIIICDDCSTDESWEVITEYSQRYSEVIKAYRHERNIGHQRNGNFGAKKAKGDLITRIDGDDRWLPRKLELEWEALQRYPDAQIAYSNVYTIDAEGNRTGIWYAGKGPVPPSGDVFVQAFSRVFFSNCSSIFRNELVHCCVHDEVGYFDEDLEIFLDWDFKIRATAQFPVVYSGEVLVEYRIHDQGIHNSPRELLYKDILAIYKKNLPLLASRTEQEAIQIKKGVESLLNSIMPGKPLHLELSSIKPHFKETLKRNGSAIVTHSGKNKMGSNLGEQLIFLISQPRAGSTLLQRILSGHPKIHTMAEPWIMLHPLYALKRNGIAAEYESSLARQGLDDFLMQVPEGEELYIKALRGMASVLYNRALELSGKSFFLDKTPRYYFIIPELYRVFPKAKFIFLLRNPMAVLSSVLSTWFGNQIQALVKSPSHYIDLTKGPHYLVEGIKKLKEDAIVVHYENLVREPKEVIQHVCNRIGIPFYENMLEYGQHPAPKGRFGDSVGVHKHNRPVSDYIDKWVKNLAAPNLIEFTSQYLSSLGSDVFSNMGYSYQEIKDKLGAQGSLNDQEVSQKKIKESTVLNQQGEDLFTKGDTEGALNALRKAIEIAPNFATAHNNLGVLYWQAGEVQKAVEHFAKALEIDPNDRDTILNCGELFKSLEKIEDAKNVYSSYLQKNPSDAEVARALEGLTLRGENYSGKTASREQTITYTENDQPMISVITPSLNQGRFIEQTIQSVLRQNYSNFEHIIIDGGSTDGTAEVLKKYPHLKLVSELDRSQSDALNKGFRIATGDIIAWINSDDWYEPEVFRSVAEFLIKNPDKNVVMGNCNLVDENGNIFDKVINHERGFDELKKYWVPRSIPTQPAIFFRRRLLNDFGLLDESLHYGMDYDLWMRFAQKNRFYHLDVTVANYRFHHAAKGGDRDWSKFVPEWKLVLERYSKLPGSEPLVSVVIPCYNYGCYLREAVESVIVQTLQDFEIIIVNDGSTDNSKDVAEELIREYPQHRITLLDQKNSGQPAISRNNGIAIATGEYILPLDADDKLHPQALENYYNKIKGYGSNPVVAYGWIQRFGAETGLWRTQPFEPNQLLRRGMLPYSSMYHRSVWELQKRYKTNTPGYEDWDFWIGAAEMGAVFINVPMITLFYRRTDSDSLVDKARKRHEWLVAGIISNHPNIYEKEEVAWATDYLQRFPEPPIDREFHGPNDRFKSATAILVGSYPEYYSPEEIAWAKQHLEKEPFVIQRGIKKDQLIPRKYVSRIPKVDGHISEKQSIRLFLAALDEFNKKKFLEAEKLMGEYAKHANYDGFYRKDNRKSTNPKISVIVVAYQSNILLLDCLDSLSNQTEEDFEVILVDNGGNEKVKGKLDSYPICYIRPPINFILSEGRNIGVHYARGKIVAFLDDDAIVPENYIKTIKKAFDTYDICGFRGRVLPKTENANNKYASHYDLGDIPIPATVDAEGNSAFIRNVYLEMNGMNSLLFSGEGLELSYRISRRYGEYSTIYWPKTIIYHDYAITDDKLKDKANRNSLMKKYLLQKHPDIYDYHLRLNNYSKNKELQKRGESFLKRKESFGSKNVRISICIPTYNREKFVQRAIKSALNQKYDNYEIVVVDDGSTDRTVEAIKSFNSDKIRCITKEHSGAPETRTKAVQEARGEYIVWLDSDDEFTEDIIREYISYIEKYHDFDVLYCNNIRIYEEVNKSQEIRYSSYIGKIPAGKFLGGPPIPNVGTMIKKDLFEKIGFYNREFIRAHDYEFWVRAQPYARFRHCPKILYLHHFHNQGNLSPIYYDDVDTSYEIRITDYIINNYSVEALFPEVDWENLGIENKNNLMAKVYYNYAQIYKKWKDLNRARDYALKSIETNKTKEVNEFLRNINSLLKSQLANLSRNKNDVDETRFRQKFKEIAFPITAIIAAYNEGDIIYHVIRDFIEQGIKVYFIDHHSTDNTVAEATKWLGKGLIKIEQFPDDSGFDLPKDVYIWRYILKRKEQIAKELGAGWYIHADADEFREAPWLNLNLKEGIEKVDKEGYNAIFFKIFDFKPTDNSFILGEDARQYLQYYSRPVLDYDNMQVKCWKYFGQDFTLWKSGGHIVEFESQKIYPIPFILRHYSIRSQEQGEQKVFKERKNRFDKDEKEAKWHAQYDHMEENHKFIHNKSNLKLYNREDVCAEILGQVEKEKIIEQFLVSIIILTHNQLEYTKKCIKSIFKHTKEPFELIVVDNGSTDGTVEYLESEVRGRRQEHGGRKKKGKGKKKKSGKPEVRIKIIKNKENLGFAAGNNQGMAAAKGNYVVLMNNDLVVTPGWLTRMMACAERKPQIGIVGPVSNCVSGPQLIKEVSYDTTSLARLNKFSNAFSKKHAGQAKPFWRVVGFCMLIKRAVIEKIGGLDGRFGLGNFEDDDFSLRAALAGFESWIAQDCFVHHFGSRTFVGAKINYRESLHKNWEIFKQKWGIPADVAYGASYDMASVVKDGFIPAKHYCPLMPEEYSVDDGEKLFGMGDIDGAERIFEQVLSVAPNNIEALNNLGVIAFQQGRTDQAISYFTRVLETDESYFEAIENLGKCGEAQKDYLKAAEWFKRALKLKPDDIGLLNSLGNCFIQAENLSKARDVYEKSFGLDGGQENIKVILRELGGLEEAKNKA